MSTDQVVVKDQRAEDRYEIHVDGTLAGFLEYERQGSVVSLLHTEVFDAFEGRGLGGRLVSEVLDELRAEGLRADVQCPYVNSYIERHPEYADLKA